METHQRATGGSESTKISQRYPALMADLPFARFMRSFRWIRACKLFCVLAGLIPISLVLWYAISQGRQVPVGNQWWDPVYIAIKTRTGTLTLEDLFVSSIGHRPLIIRVVTALYTLATDYEAGLLAFATFVVTLLNLCMALLLLKANPRLVPVLLFFFSIVLFTLYDPDSWLDMYYSVWQIALFFTLTGLFILQTLRPGWLAFAFLILAAVGASFSIGSGLAAWIALPLAALGRREYRRVDYAIVWFVFFSLFLAFYMSNYAVNPFKSEYDGPSLRDGVVSSASFLFQFQAARFGIESDTVALALTLAASLVGGVNLWLIMSSKNGVAIASVWGALASFAFVNAAIVLLGRGVSLGIASRYSPGADGLWLSIIALGVLVLARRPSLYIVSANVALLATVVIMSAWRDIQSIYTFSDAQIAAACDHSIVEYPLYRNDHFHQCFEWSEDQSVYHLAALRLSVFRKERQRLILPQTNIRIITDMPNRWLSVYVRDYMLRGIKWEDIYSLAPMPGIWALRTEPNTSPFYRGEWSTEILPQPLRQVWGDAAALTSDLSMLAADQPQVWYLNTPETEGNFPAIVEAFRKLDFTGSKYPISEPYYASAHFNLWCFERTGSGGCAR
jgi:hypothetical protein